MIQRMMIMQAWEKVGEGKPDAATEKAKAFFEFLLNNQELCWKEMTKVFREKYYDAFDKVAATLFATDDPLIIYNFIRFADLNNAKEVKVLEKFIEACDAEKHQVSLYALEKTRVERLVKAVKKKKEPTR